jgi:quercetin dioxygenase-like cupin family protein
MAYAGSSLRRMARRRRLTTHAHAVYRLAPDLLLVFKPRGHREDTHAHPHRQRLRVLRGRLEVRAGGRRIILDGARPLTLAAGRSHSTRALADTWLTAESLPAAATHRAARR